MTTKRKLDEGRYSKVSRRVWGDERFGRLSAPKPNAQTLWLRLLTGPELGCVPGLFAAREGGIADALGWPLATFRKCWAEISRENLAKADWRCGLVWIPNAITHNEPASPNTVASWRKTANELPECELRREAFDSLARFLEDMGQSWIGAWGLAASAPYRPCKIIPDVRRAIQARDGNRCRYCAVVVDWQDRRGPTGATYDHVDPSGDGTEANVVVACRSCNSRKGFRTPSSAGLVLLSSVPRSDLDRNLGPDLDPSRNQEQEQEQEREIPLPPSRPETGPAPERSRLRDPMAGTFLPIRPDVVELHARWREALERRAHVLRGPSDLDAVTLAEAIDAHGLAECLTALAVAPNDSMVNGSGDQRGEKHPSIRYIFGNEQTFARLVAAAEKTRDKPGIMGVGFGPLERAMTAVPDTSDVYIPGKKAPRSCDVGSGSSFGTENDPSQVRIQKPLRSAAGAKQ